MKLIQAGSIKLNGHHRLDAEVLFGALKTHLTLDTGDPRIHDEVQALRDKLIEVAKEDSKALFAYELGSLTDSAAT